MVSQVGLHFLSFYNVKGHIQFKYKVAIIIYTNMRFDCFILIQHRYGELEVAKVLVEEAGATIGIQ